MNILCRSVLMTVCVYLDTAGMMNFGLWNGMKRQLLFVDMFLKC